MLKLKLILFVATQVALWSGVARDVPATHRALRAGNIEVGSGVKGEAIATGVISTANVVFYVLRRHHKAAEVPFQSTTGAGIVYGVKTNWAATHNNRLAATMQR